MSRIRFPVMIGRLLLFWRLIIRLGVMMLMDSDLRRVVRVRGVIGRRGWLYLSIGLWVLRWTLVLLGLGIFGLFIRFSRRLILLIVVRE